MPSSFFVWDRTCCEMCCFLGTGGDRVLWERRVTESCIEIFCSLAVHERWIWRTSDRHSFKEPDIVPQASSKFCKKANVCGRYHNPLPSPGELNRRSTGFNGETISPSILLFATIKLESSYTHPTNLVPFMIYNCFRKEFHGGFQRSRLTEVP